MPEDKKPKKRKKKTNILEKIIKSMLIPKTRDEEIETYRLVIGGLAHHLVNDDQEVVFLHRVLKINSPEELLKLIGECRSEFLAKAKTV